MLFFKSIFSDLFIYFKRTINYIYWNINGVRVTLNSDISRKANIKPNSSLVNYSFVGEEATIGSSTYGNQVFIQHAKIGDFCSLAPGVKIGLEEHDLNAKSTHPYFYDSKLFNLNTNKTTIGDHVWIGANAVVLKGVRVDNHAVVAAGAVVTQDIPAYEIWGGVPAKFIKKRIIDNL